VGFVHERNLVILGIPSRDPVLEIILYVQPEQVVIAYVVVFPSIENGKGHVQFADLKGAGFSRDNQGAGVFQGPGAKENSLVVIGRIRGHAFNPGHGVDGCDGVSVYLRKKTFPEGSPGNKAAGLIRSSTRLTIGF
jgi:hypothetical protein